MGETRRWVGLLLGTAFLATAACSGDDSDDAGGAESTTSEAAEGRSEEAVGGGGDVVFPSEEWEQRDPDELGFDVVALERIAADAEAIGSECLVVVRDGRVVGEWYWGGAAAETTHEAWSITKSYTSTLVGIAQDDGLLDIDDRASDFIDEWVGTPSEDITIRQLLSGTSGRRSTSAGADTALITALFAAPDATAFTIGLDQVEPPGTVWSNNEAAIQNFDAILDEAIGQTPGDFAQERLLGPIGASHTQMTGDAAGNTYMPFRLQTTCQDAARFGHLLLNNGKWDGTQVVSEEWVAEATQPSQDLNGGYGYLWWLNQERELDPEVAASTGAAPGAAQMVPEAPEDLFWALGAFGQVIQVHPSSGTVVVRFGPGEEIYDPDALQTVARVVTEALAD